MGALVLLTGGASEPDPLRTPPSDRARSEWSRCPTLVRPLVGDVVLNQHRHPISEQWLERPLPRPHPFLGELVGGTDESVHRSDHHEISLVMLDLPVQPRLV